MKSLICEAGRDIQRRSGLSTEKKSHMNERKDAGELKEERVNTRIVCIASPLMMISIRFSNGSRHGK